MRIGVGLSIPELSTRGGRFSPASLFTGGVQGAWYAPDDFSTLFQDSAGTTPVTAVEQPVGLMLDKSQGLVLGPEIIVNGDFSGGSTGWTPQTNWSIASGKASGAATNTNLVTTTGGYTTGKWYLVTFTISDYVGGSVLAWIRGNYTPTAALGNGTFTRYIAAGSGSDLFLFTGSGFTGSIDNISVKELPGNHASQATTASRPVLRARYNLLTYSEQFDNAVWVRTGIDAFGSGSVANATTAPDGTTTADFIRPGTVSSSQRFTQNPSPAQTAQTLSVYVKASGYFKVALKESATTGNYASFDLSTGTVLANTAGVGTSITALANSWYRISMTLASAGSCGLQVSVLAPAYTTGDPNSSAFSGDGTSGMFVWGAQLVTGSSAGTYQRIAAATDYATAGFLPYLALDGTDDSFGTNSIDFSATDKISICAGVTKLSDAAAAILVELSANFNSNTGSFFVAAPSDVLVPYSCIGRGNGLPNTNQTSAFGSSTFRAPDTCVLTATGDISGDANIVRRNSVAAATGTFDQGSGNYGNYPLYIGRRANTSLPVNGRIYQLIVCGKTLSASELASTEAYVATKTGVTL